MHFQWTINLGSLLETAASLAVVGPFLLGIYRKLSEMIHETKRMVEEHNEMWWHYQTGQKPNGQLKLPRYRNV